MVWSSSLTIFSSFELYVSRTTTKQRLFLTTLRSGAVVALRDLEKKTFDRRLFLR